MDLIERVEKYFYNDGPLCEACPFKHAWAERHPYGSTTADEHLCECRVPSPEQCPAMEDDDA